MPQILVIDDSPSVLAFVAKSLVLEGHQVLTAPTGKKGVEILQQQKVDLIITDMYMPEADGLEVLRNVRKLCPGTGVIVMSGKRGDLNMFAVAKALGVISTLQKPFTREELNAHVTAALGRRPVTSARPSPAAALPLPPLTKASL